MTTISKLKMMMMAAFAIVCGMTLNSCDDDDDPTPLENSNKIDHVETHVTCKLSQDLYQLLDVELIGKVEQTKDNYTKEKSIIVTAKEEKYTDFMTMKSPDYTYTLTGKATATPKAYKESEIKASYSLDFEITEELVAYYKDGHEEIVTDNTFSMPSNKQGLTINGKPSKEDLDHEVSTLANAIETWFSYKVYVTKGTEFGKEVVRLMKAE